MLKTYDIQDVPCLKILGRHTAQSAPLPLFWTHSGIEVNCTGTELWVEVSCNYEFHDIWVASEINHALMSRQMLYPGKNSICLFRSMQPGVVKNVRFYRELQAMYDNPEITLEIRGLRTDGEFLPVPENKLKIEFIGDSITSGEGSYGAREDTEWLAMYMSASKTYVNFIERMLDAESRVISQGGWGVYTGWDNNRSHNIPRIYDQICVPATGSINKARGAQYEYDFSSWVPDAIIVNLGTNDACSFTMPGMEVEGYGFCKSRTDEQGNKDPEDLKAIENAAVDFLKHLRSKNPTSLIIWTYGMMGNELEPVLRSAMDRFISETNDTNAEYIALPDTTWETMGAHSHPGFFSHLATAKLLAAHLAEHFHLEAKYDILL
ncbi:MAG: GDSL family lipase [Lachnospiraceae bacterium]|nr:GDSL family lipase [Lachnospiraceae bacterium]